MPKAKEPTIDLHGYKTDEVYDALDQFLRKHSSKKRVRIMTGKGIVQKETLQYLKQAGYPWQYEKSGNGQPNTGVLVVFMD